MTNFEKKILEIIDSPERELNKEESLKLLRDYGILDENNCITPKFEGIVTEKQNNI